MTAALIVGAVAVAIATVSSVVGATGFSLTHRAWNDATRRDGRLGIAAAIYAAAMVGATGSDVITGGSNGSTTAAAAFGVAGDVTQMAAAVTIAIAFFGSVDRQRRGVHDWLQRRDRIIAAGFVGLFLGFLFLAVADLISAGQGQLVPSLYQAGRWVAATGSLTILIPLGCAVAAFLISGRRTT